MCGRLLGEEVGGGVLDLPHCQGYRVSSMGLLFSIFGCVDLHFVDHPERLSLHSHV